ncbi:glycosyltransferase family 2 protein [Microvirga sp. M2]|uniref:glycosyltransferase family 2 protein n=1 Tax=Microvirga sp. M2 TaxID=3073270 RepID=UPI0039C4B141
MRTIIKGFPIVASPKLSVIIPVHNESANIRPLCERLFPVLDRIGLPWEVVFVDDGSRDDTLDAIRALSQREPRVGAISFSRNFGKEIAIAAGLDHARGQAVVIMDADLQHPPEMIEAFVERWRQGYDMVYGQRTDRSDETRVKRGFAHLFYRLFARFGEIGLPEGAGDFRLIDRKGVEVLRAMGEKARFSKGLYAWIGFKSTGVPFVVEERRFGTSKWSFRKLFRFAFDGIAAFSTVPLRVWTYLGFLISFLSIAAALYFLIRTLLFGTDLPGFPSLIVSIMFFSGIQLMSLGIIGEYVGRIFAEVKRRPLYVVAERIGGTAEVSDSLVPVHDQPHRA